MTERPWSPRRCWCTEHPVAENQVDAGPGGDGSQALEQLHGIEQLSCSGSSRHSGCVVRARASRSSPCRDSRSRPRRIPSRGLISTPPRPCPRSSRLRDGIFSTACPPSDLDVAAVHIDDEDALHGHCEIHTSRESLTGAGSGLGQSWSHAMSNAGASGKRGRKYRFRICLDAVPGTRNDSGSRDRLRMSRSPTRLWVSARSSPTSSVNLAPTPPGPSSAFFNTLPPVNLGRPR